MNEINLKNQPYIGSNNKSGFYDIEIVDSTSKSIVLFIHGYMGFKDWGCWNLVQNKFTSARLNFCKYNITHGGTTLANPLEFDDLQSFSKNSYLREYQDCLLIIQHLKEQYAIENVHLIGHSRGGGIALLMQSVKEVKSITTWAAICTIEGRMKSGEELEKWKKEGNYTIKNGRTNQEMPHSYSAYEEFDANRELLSIEDNCKELSKPLLIIHGDEDTSVSISEGKKISELTQQELIIIPGTNHTFDSSHPWAENSLPSALEKACATTITFIQSVD